MKVMKEHLNEQQGVTMRCFNGENISFYSNLGEKILGLLTGGP